MLARQGADLILLDAPQCHAGKKARACIEDLALDFMHFKGRFLSSAPWGGKVVILHALDTLESAALVLVP